MEKHKNTINLIKKILQNQKFGVLSTIRRDQPHSSLVCFCSSKDLSKIVFFTVKESRKIINSRLYDNVEIFINNALNNSDDITQAITIEAIGSAKVEKNIEMEELQKLKSLFLQKHPYLESFVSSESTQMVLIKVKYYHIVQNFQTVIDWKPSEIYRYETNHNEPIYRQIQGKVIKKGFYRGKAKIINNVNDFVENDNEVIIILKDKDIIKKIDLKLCKGLILEMDDLDQDLQNNLLSKDFPSIITNEPITRDNNLDNDISIDGFLGIIIIHRENIMFHDIEN